MTIENWPALLGKVISGDSLTVAEAATTMRSVMNNELSEARLAGLLVALKSRGETVDEVVGFRDAILEAAEPIKISTDAVDIVGSGETRSGSSMFLRLPRLWLLLQVFR